jgi:hypothetical protein
MYRIHMRETWVMSTFSNNVFLQNKHVKREKAMKSHGLRYRLQPYILMVTNTHDKYVLLQNSPLLKQRLQLKDENTLSNCIDTTFLYNTHPHWHKHTQRNTISTSSIIIAASSNILCRSLLISDRLTHRIC